MLLIVGLGLFRWFVVCLARCFVQVVVVCIFLWLGLLLPVVCVVWFVSLLVCCSLLVVGSLRVNSVGMNVLDLY